VKGEWDATFSTSSATIYAPDGSVWAKGSVQTFQSQIWITESGKGTIKGIFVMTNTPEVLALTIGFGQFGAAAPESLDGAMTSGNVFVLMKCLNAAVCKWNTQDVFGMHQIFKFLFYFARRFRFFLKFPPKTL
jgi:hypothetical protein